MENVKLPLPGGDGGGETNDNTAQLSLVWAFTDTCILCLPNHQQWNANWKFRWNMYTLHTRVFAQEEACTTEHADLHAQSVIINKISASELRRKLTKGALLVGQVN